MTEAVQVALIVAIAPTLVAFGGIVVSVLTLWSAHRKLNHITVLTNSTLTAANKRIDDLEQIVKDLRRLNENDHG